MAKEKVKEVKEVKEVEEVVEVKKVVKLTNVSNNPQNLERLGVVLKTGESVDKELLTKEEIKLYKGILK